MRLLDNQWLSRAQTVSFLIGVPVLIGGGATSVLAAATNVPAWALWLTAAGGAITGLGLVLSIPRLLKWPLIVAGQPNSVSSTLPPGATATNIFIWSVALRNQRDGGGRKATAREVVAKIEAFPHGESRPVAVAHGRWGRKFGDEDYGQAPETVDFPPTHQDRILNVAIKALEHREGKPPRDVEYCYLVNGSDLLKGFWIWPQLPYGEYRVEISLRGDGLRGVPRFRYLLRNNPERCELVEAD